MSNHLLCCKNTTRTLCNQDLAIAGANSGDDMCVLCHTCWNAALCHDGTKCTMRTGDMAAALKSPTSVLHHHHVTFGGEQATTGTYVGDFSDQNVLWVINNHSAFDGYDGGSDDCTCWRCRVLRQGGWNPAADFPRPEENLKTWATGVRSGALTTDMMPDIICDDCGCCPCECDDDYCGECDCSPCECMYPCGCTVGCGCADCWNCHYDQGCECDDCEARGHEARFSDWSDRHVWRQVFLNEAQMSDRNEILGSVHRVPEYNYASICDRMGNFYKPDEYKRIMTQFREHWARQS